MSIDILFNDALKEIKNKQKELIRKAKRKGKAVPVKEAVSYQLEEIKGLQKIMGSSLCSLLNQLLISDLSSILSSENKEFVYKNILKDLYLVRNHSELLIQLSKEIYKANSNPQDYEAWELSMGNGKKIYVIAKKEDNDEYDYIL